MSLLFKSIELRDLTVSNRIGMAPMCQYVSPDGFASDWHKVHLGARAIGGVGLIVVEATAVTPEGRVTPYDLGLWSDAFVPRLSELASFVEAQGSIPAIQLSHAGRKASRSRPWEGDAAIAPEHGGWEPIGPSAVPFAASYAVPREMSLSEIADAQASFVSAAKRAHAAGFKMIELHAGHGRLFHNFYSPLSNLRTDAYGGSAERRARFLVETCQAVRKVWPARYPLTVRLSCTDWVEGAFALSDAVSLARMLKEVGVDLIDCSSGGIVRTARVKTAPGYQVEFASTIRREANIATAAVGLITDARQAERVLAEGHADMIFMGRELLRHPHWALDARKELTANAGEYYPLPYRKGFVYDENRQGHLAEL